MSFASRTAETMSGHRMQIELWGVRGSIPTPTAANLGHGGNTSCVEVRTPGGERLIFDAGTGIRNLGIALRNASASQPSRTHLFFTHYHWDHIQGLPFFAPLYHPLSTICLHSGPTIGPIHAALANQMDSPFFPLKMEAVAAQLQFHDLDDQPLTVGDARIESFPLCHPQGACGYRITCGGAVFVHATDNEPGDPHFDAILQHYARNADLLIYDAQYTPEEVPRMKGWGHGNWASAVRLAQECQVRRLVLFHHDPDRDDAALTRIAQAAQAVFPATECARERAVIML